MDIAPTLYDYYQINPPVEIEGESLLNVNREAKDYYIYDGTLKFEDNKFSTKIIDGSYIYIRDDWNFNEAKLFNVKDGKLVEINNKKIMEKYQNIERNHREYIYKKQKYYSGLYSDSEYCIDKKLEEQLKALGYIT